MRSIGLIALILLCLTVAGSGCSKSPPTDPKTLAVKGQEILNNNCLRCHGPQQRVFDLNKRDELLAKKSPKRQLVFLVPGKPEDSAIWKVLEEDQMPPGPQKLKPEDKQILKKWIEAGAPAS